jgi:hypothetical protein
MRCMVCGEEKLLAEAIPAEDMAVPGFEYQTLECPGCNDTERRLLFTGRVTVFARRKRETVASPRHPDQLEQEVETPTSNNAPNSEVISNSSRVEVSTDLREKEPILVDGMIEFPGEVTERVIPETHPPVITPEPDASAGSNISVDAWLHAVEKLRSYQAGLQVRAEEAKKRNRNIEFDIAWDRFAGPGHWPIPPAQPRNRVQSHRKRLRRQRLSTARGRRSQLPAPAQEGDAEAVRRFNEFWNSLAPSRIPAQPESSAPASLAALPLSLGVKLLEAVEAAVSSR